MELDKDTNLTWHEDFLNYIVMFLLKYPSVLDIFLGFND